MTTTGTAPPREGRRSFVAVPLPPRIRAELFGASASLASQLPSAKWSRKVENLHITVKFLGKVDDQHLAALGTALKEAMARLPPFEVSVKSIGAFPGATRANVIWAGVDDATVGLARIAEVVERLATAHLSIAEPEGRPFRAHVTLGRAKPPTDVRAALGAWSGRMFGSFAVDQVHLYESQLSPRGSTHVLLAAAPLGR